jgi:hypothetical protein
MRAGAVVMGSGRWTGRSREDHPDFAWYPYLARAENPEVQYATVRQLLGQASPAAPPSAPETAPPPAVSPEVAVRVDSLPGPNDPAPCSVLTPVELAALVANRTSDFDFDVTVDRFDGGMYRAGEPITVRDNTQQARYLDNHDNLSLLYPPPGHPGRIDARTPTNVPGANDNFVFRVGTTPGQHRIKAVVTTRPITLSGRVVAKPQPQQQQDRRHGQAPTRSAVVEQTFRWPPAQQQQVQAILHSYAAQNAPQRVEGADPRQIVGRFAQDEVRFIVEPAGKPVKPPQASQSQNPK